MRLIQSIPSPKAEPFKQWLAHVGAERITEIENPELAQSRIRATYKAKGYSDEWIEKRMRGILVRDELTNEWKQRGVREGKEYSILTAEISKATFGIAPSEYKNLKGLTKSSENLLDHMTDLELIFTILGDKILNINSTYICFNEEETINKTFKTKRGFLFFGQIISTTIFLSFLISFTFSVNFFNFNWFDSVLKQHYLVKAAIILTLSITRGLITPFTLDVKNKKNPFIGWPGMIAKVILSIVGAGLINYYFK